jgi:hypothetical protein
MLVRTEQWSYVPFGTGRTVPFRFVPLLLLKWIMEPSTYRQINKLLKLPLRQARCCCFALRRFLAELRNQESPSRPDVGDIGDSRLDTRRSPVEVGGNFAQDTHNQFSCEYCISDVPFCFDHASDLVRGPAENSIAGFRHLSLQEPANPEDGVRFLIERLWPRGIKKDACTSIPGSKMSRQVVNCAAGSDVTRRNGPCFDGATSPTR